MDYQTLWRSCARQGPNCIDLGAIEFSEYLLTSKVTTSGALLELHIIRGLQVCCSTKARQDMRRRVPNRLMAYYLVRTILNLKRECTRILVGHMDVKADVRVEV